MVGVETIAHLREVGNGRITIMLSAFEGPPRICRLFGTGKSLYILGLVVFLKMEHLYRQST